jgi:hypothetical protein
LFLYIRGSGILFSAAINLKPRRWRSQPIKRQKLWIPRVCRSRLKTVVLVRECLCQGKQNIPHRWTVACSGLHTVVPCTRVSMPGQAKYPTQMDSCL